MTSPTRAAFLLAGILVAVPFARAAAEADAFPTFEDYLKLSGQAVWTDGHGAAFQAQNWTSKSGAGGIEDFLYSKDLSKDVTMKMDGHALASTADYLAHVNISKSETASVDFGYQRFRTFYDGFGGFFPTNNSWVMLNNTYLSLDRSKLWVEATVNLPQKPVFRVRYVNELRNGEKPSTIWGDSDFTGISIWSLSSLNPVSATRKIVPSYIQIGERHQTLEASLEHTVGKTTVRLAVIGEDTSNLDRHFMNRYPGELKPYPAIASTPATLVSPSLANNPISGYDQQGIKSKTMSYLAKVDSILSDRVTLHIGATVQHTMSGLTSDREMALGVATAAGTKTLVGGFASGGRPTSSYVGLAGSVKQLVYTGNVGLDLRLAKNLSVELATRAEESTTSSANPLAYINQGVTTSTGVVVNLPLAVQNNSRTKETSWVQELNVRYTGIRNVTLYLNGDFRYAPGDEWAVCVTPSASGLTVSGSTTSGYANTSENHGNIKAGANWTVTPKITLRAEGFEREHRDAFYGYGSSRGSRFVLDYGTKGARLSAVVKPCPTLSSTTRYISEFGKVNVTATTSDKYSAGDCKDYQISETVDWNPTKLFYMQANASIVFDTISTSYPRAGGSANDVLHDASNDYWSGSVIAGFAVDKCTDAQLQYTGYHADNFQPALAATTMPYGTSVSEDSVTLGLKHKFSDSLVGSFKVGYINSRNDTLGGRANYKAKLACMALEYKL